MQIKHLLQDQADTKAAIGTLKKEGRGLAALVTRDATQETRFAAIFAEMDTLEAKLETIEADLVKAKRLQADELEEGRVAFEALEVGTNRAKDQKVTFGEFLQAVAYMQAPHMAAAAGYRMAEHVKASLFAASGASSGVSADGGFLVRSEYSTALLDKAQEASQLLSRCDNFPIGEGNDSLEAPYINETSRATGSRWGGVQVYRAAEAATVTAAKPGLGKFELRLEDMMGIGYATERVLRDATLLQSIFEKAFASEFAFKFDDECIRGTGTGQNLGVINAGCTVTVSKETAQTADTVNPYNIRKMFLRMTARNMPRAEWYINQEVLDQLWQMSISVGTAGGQLVYMPPGGMSQAPYGTLLGKPVNVLEQCSGLGDLGDIIFADWSEYAVISKAMTAADSMHVRFLQNERTFRWVYPIIGKPKLADAITAYKATNNTTLSPFVILQAR